MHVRVLGTGAADGWPNPFCSCESCTVQRTAGRLRGQTSALVDDVLLLDCGPETPHAAHRAGVDLTGLRFVLITHAHPDHCAPAFLLFRSWVSDDPLDVVGPPDVIEQARPWVAPDSTVRFTAVAPGDVLTLGAYEVRVLAADHIEGAVLYDVSDGDQRLFYATDTGPLPESTVTAVTDARFDVVLMEETFGSWRDHGTHHLDLATFAAQVARLRAVGAIHDDTDVVAVHLSHHHDPSPPLQEQLAAVGARVVDDGTVVGHHEPVTSSFVLGPADPPSGTARAEAVERLAGLATPAGALGRLGDLAVWVAATQGVVPPEPVDRVRAVIFAGDHGIARHGVSAYPPEVTPAMVQLFLAGRAGVSALARQHDVAVRVLDIAVDADLAGPVAEHKIRRGSGAIHLEDALTPDETRAALDAGATVAAEEIAAGAQLLIGGDMGIGNTTPAAALIAATLGLPASEVTGRGTGVDGATLAHKIALVQQALDRAGDRIDDPVDTLTALGSADLAAAAGFMATAAQRGVPVLLDGVISVASAVMADRLAPGAAAWFAAGHRSTEPAQAVALDKLGLEPVLDLGMRLGEGSGAVAAVPLVRSAALMLRDVALLADLDL
jgi:nicotinate-nucleotide--dimethylbenzimidazole phosphoribosyltransferase